MEASPSPQCVGREFVRQYYTLLNRAPAHLHRFVLTNSIYQFFFFNYNTNYKIKQSSVKFTKINFKL